MTERLVVNLRTDGLATVLNWPDGGIPEEVSRRPLQWPLDADALEDLRWYLEDYLLAPYGVWEVRGPTVAERIGSWGEEVFASIFGGGPARDAYQRARDRRLEVLLLSADPGLLGLPWELMRAGSGAVALSTEGISRALPIIDAAGTTNVAGGRLRVLMVISRPAGTSDVGYRMVARPLLERLGALRGEVDLTVLRPPTFDALKAAVLSAEAAGEPFHIVHFDGHGLMSGRATAGPLIDVRPAMMTSPVGEGLLTFEKHGGGPHNVTASAVASVLAAGRVPVVVLNACQSGAIGKDLEASVATALLKAGCSAVVAMAYSVYAVAAAEFMAEFYESLFTGATISQAVTAGRRRLSERNLRPSRKGDLPLADWLVPVHYMRRDVSFPQVMRARPADALELSVILDTIRKNAFGQGDAADPLVPADGVFVGRDDLFWQLETASQRRHVVVLTGPGGTGKTELAKGFARWQRDTGGVDQGLAHWHPFEPGVASFSLDGAITSLGLQVFGNDFARLESAARLEAVKLLLARYRVLWVWDNFEAVREMPDLAGSTPSLDDDAGRRLRDFLWWVRDHSRSTILITSRAQEQWLGDVHRIGLGGLNRAEAAEYAEYLLAPYPAAQARRDSPMFGELLDWLDGHPLAMRLTLPRLHAAGPGLLLAGLQGTTPLDTDEEENGGRLSSLGKSVAYSYGHLAEDTRRLLPAVSLFHGVADRDILTRFSSVEGVPPRFAGVTEDRWTTALDDAAGVGLLTGIGAGMYRIHPALPAYLTSAWQAEDPDAYWEVRAAAKGALCAACAALSQWLAAQTTSRIAAFAYATVHLQSRTLGAMLGHALDHDMWTEAEYIVRTLNHYWDARGLRTEADAWADRILDATTESGEDAPARGGHADSLWLYIAAELAGRQQQALELDGAERTYERLLSWLQDQPPTAWTFANLAVFFHRLGMIAQQRGRLDEAENWYRQSLAIEEERGNIPGMAVSYHWLGISAQNRGRLDEADHWYRRALKIFEELRSRPNMADTYHQLGSTAHLRGRLDEADNWYRRALTIFEELRNRPDMATSYHDLGSLAQGRGRLDEADHWYRRSLAIREELGDQPGMAGTYHHLGISAQYRGRLEEAEDWHRRAVTIREQLGDRPGVATGYHELGIISQRTRAVGRRRALVPQVACHQRAARRSARHGRQLPPTWHRRPSPRSAGGSPGLVPQVPSH